MCDHHHLHAQPKLGEIEHANYLSEDIGKLFLHDDYSDVLLLVENSSFPVHKVIMAARSEYFRALLFGGLKESSPTCVEIQLKDTTASSFQHLLRYIYTGRMNLLDMKEETLLDVLGLADRYGFVELVSSVSDYLQAILNLRNVCLIYDIASMYSLKGLQETCCQFMDQKAGEVIQSEAFLNLSPEALSSILVRNSFCASEIEIFKAVCSWAEINKEAEVAGILRAVRLPLVSLQDLLNIVRPSGIVSADVILDAIKVKNESRDTELNYRGHLLMEENVATLRHGAKVVRGEMKAALLDGDTTNYDLDRGFTRHPIDDSCQQGIVIKLAMPCIINNIRMLLWDRDMRSYSYTIDVSMTMEDRDWVRVIDHSHFPCRSWQYLRLPERVIRYVRVAGTHNTVNRVFHLVTLECLYTRQSCELDNGIIIAHENVATIQASACVIEGVSRSRNALINGDTKNYDWDSGYTCHQLGSGAIVVQLAQPYVISSMRMLLWDCDGRSYSYYVEVSCDQQHWQLVADRTKEACRSWQTIVFPACPVNFIKIVGTHNTANEVFHCVHFECPANSDALLEHQSKTVSGGSGRSSVMQQALMDVPLAPSDDGDGRDRSGVPQGLGGLVVGGGVARAHMLQGLHHVASQEGDVDREDGYGVGLAAAVHGPPPPAMYQPQGGGGGGSRLGSDRSSSPTLSS